MGQQFIIKINMKRDTTDAPSAINIPNDMKRLRACIRCKIIKTENQFLKYGCPNCPFFNMKNKIESVMLSTSPNFQGVISLMNPKESWVGKWTRAQNHVPGCYCIDITGDIT